MNKDVTCYLPVEADDFFLLPLLYCPQFLHA